MPNRTKSKAKPVKKAAPKPKAVKPQARSKARPATAKTKPAPKAVKAAPAKAAVAKLQPLPPARPGGKGLTLKSVAPSGRTTDGKAGAAPRKSGSSRRSPLANRRGPDGELFVPGDLVIPGGAQNGDELLYFFRGCSAAERQGALEAGFNELIAKRHAEHDTGLKTEVMRLAQAMARRFETGPIEQLLPNRPQPPRRSFQGVAERAKGRRREMGAFMRGLDLGRTETSHMDSHGEASLQGLMEWAARLEILAEADEPQQADYGQFHRVLDQLDSTTEALIVDVEQTLRRLRDRLQAR